MLIPRAGQAQAASSGVFSTRQTDLVPDIGVALEPATMRSRVVNVDTQRITAARLGRESLTLNLFDDTAVAVQIDRVRPTRSGYFITGPPGRLRVGRSPAGRERPGHGGHGGHAGRQVHDPFRGCRAPRRPSGRSVARGVGGRCRCDSAAARSATDRFTWKYRFIAAGSRERRYRGTSGSTDEDGSEIRILFAYTPALLAQEGGVAGVQALIDLMIHTANHAFEISGIQDLQLVLVHSVLLDYVETDTAVGGIVSIGSVHAVRSLDRDPGCSCGRWRNRRQRGIDPRLSLGRIESDRVSHAGIGRAPCRVWNNRHICRP